MSANTIRLQTGMLWHAIARQRRQALARGVLQPIETNCTFIDDGDVRFVVRSVSRERKVEDKTASQRRAAANNPFLPYEEALFVADISNTHIALLNKFNVIDHHLLIVTRDAEDQEALLTLNDLHALWACMTEFEALAFYNGGTVAGASQRHKHLQMVPLPLAPQGPAIPIEPLIAKVRVGDTISALPQVPFVHAFSRLDPLLSARPDEAAAIMLERYYALLSAVGLAATKVDNALRQSGPYNLLIARSWMLLVPRSREFFDSISVNALGFAGSFFVRNDEQARAIKTVGPMKVLQQVAADGDRIGPA